MFLPLPQEHVFACLYHPSLSDVWNCRFQSVGLQRLYERNQLIQHCWCSEFFVLSDRPCRKSKSSSRKRRALSFWMGILKHVAATRTCFCQTLGEHNAFCLLTVVFAVELWLQPNPEEKAARTEGPGCTKARKGILHHFASIFVKVW